jgi:hypothetical protein
MDLETQNSEYATKFLDQKFLTKIPPCLDSGSLYRKIISPKVFDQKAISPKHHLTEHRLTECYLIESTFDRIAV